MAESDTRETRRDAEERGLTPAPHDATTSRRRRRARFGRSEEPNGHVNEDACSARRPTCRVDDRAVLPHTAPSQQGDAPSSPATAPTSSPPTTSSPRLGPPYTPLAIPPPHILELTPAASVPRYAILISPFLRRTSSSAELSQMPLARWCAPASPIALPPRCNTWFVSNDGS